ncbi:MAG: rod shape determining protein RodA [Acidimicrobiaceae bacterium]|jgi:rod shape determining protein RodA
MAVSSIPRSVPRSPASTLRRNPTAAWRHLDLVLLGCIAAVSCLGALMVYSATRGPVPPYRLTFFEKQALYVLVGFAVLVVTVVIDYRHFRDWALVFYGGACALLLFVVSPLGSKSNGAQSWFQLGSFQLQPSEFAKLALILAIANVASGFFGDIDRRRLYILLGVAALPLALIMLQPDLGTALVLTVITAGALLIAGAQGKHLVALVLVAVLGATVMLNSSFLAQYQKDRLTSFTHQEEGVRGETYNITQSKTAIGAGGTFGEGLFQGSQTRLGNVPEQHTDFIFTAVGEQLGFAGSATLLALFCIIAWRVWRTAQLARDEFGMIVCVGVLALFMFQIFENVGMTMGIMPVTGLPLPLVSYGGSSTIAEFAALGLVLNVHMRRFA